MKKIFTFITAFMLFITGFFIKKTSENYNLLEVIDISKPKVKLEEFISKIKKETDKIIIDNKIMKIEPEPIETIITEPEQTETEPIIEETTIEEIPETTHAEETIPKETEKELLTLDEIALEVIGGKWGSGDTRRNALKEAGYNYEEVAQRVNEIIAGSPYEIPDRNTFNLNFAYVPKKVDVYDEFGNVEGSLSQYQKVLLTDIKVDGMTLVHFKDQTFYLKDNEYKLLSDSHIEIDISEQKVYMYINGELILEANVVTGHPDKGSTHGTNLGRTEVYAKSYNVTFDGGKRSDMFILFNWDGEGFHDAGWREDWEFDDNTRYLTHGSNGCTNMRYEDVEIIEENSYLGMHVLVHK